MTYGGLAYAISSRALDALIVGSSLTTSMATCSPFCDEQFPSPVGRPCAALFVNLRTDVDFLLNLLSGYCKTIPSSYTCSRMYVCLL